MLSKDDGLFIGGVVTSIVVLGLCVLSVRLGIYIEKNHIVIWQRQTPLEQVR